MDTAIKDPEGALRIFLDQDEKGHVDSNVPVRWCISREIAEIIQARAIDKPMLVIVIENDGRETGRFVVPLENQMHYIQFSRPGTSTIRSTIMWSTGEDPLEKQLKKRQKYGGYSVSLLNGDQPQCRAFERKISGTRHWLWRLLDEGKDRDSKLIKGLEAKIERMDSELEELRATEKRVCSLTDDFWDMERLPISSELDVEVPKEMFAKEPNRFMKWLASRYNWERSAFDQCSLRRRALITLFTLPFVAMFLAIKRVVLYVGEKVVTAGWWIVLLASYVNAVFFGVRKLNKSVLKGNPRNYDPQDIWRHSEPTIWLYKKDKESGEYIAKHPVFLVLNPPALLFFCVVGLALYFVFSSLTLLVIALAAFVLIAIAIIVAVAAFEPVTTSLTKTKESREENQKETLRNDLEQLACSNASREVNLSALPKRRRSVSLRLQATKAKVCKPFAS